jgi:hypothetical protein
MLYLRSTGSLPSNLAIICAAQGQGSAGLCYVSPLDMFFQPRSCHEAQASFLAHWRLTSHLRLRSHDCTRPCSGCLSHLVPRTKTESYRNNQVQRPNSSSILQFPAMETWTKPKSAAGSTTTQDPRNLTPYSRNLGRADLRHCSN